MVEPVDVLDAEDAAGGVSIDDDGSDSYEYDDSGLVEAGVSTGVTGSETKYAEEVQQDVKYSSL